MRRLSSATAALGLLLASGCSRLDRFSLEPGEAYCGSVTLAGAFRDGLSPRVQLSLSWNTSEAEAGRSPGVVTTYDAGAEAGQRTLIRDAALRPIVPLENDDLALLEFGEGRERNYLYALNAADPEADSLFAIVSLRSDDRVEMRLLRSGIDDAESQSGRDPVFALFVLDRTSGACFTVSDEPAS